MVLLHKLFSQYYVHNYKPHLQIQKAYKSIEKMFLVFLKVTKTNLFSWNLISIVFFLLCSMYMYLEKKKNVLLSSSQGKREVLFFFVLFLSSGIFGHSKNKKETKKKRIFQKIKADIVFFSRQTSTNLKLKKNFIFWKRNSKDIEKLHPENWKNKVFFF